VPLTGRGGSNPPSDTNRTFTSEIRFYQHSSRARFVLEGQSETLVESSRLRRLSCTHDANEVPEVLDHHPDVVVCEQPLDGAGGAPRQPRSLPDVIGLHLDART
jgi:hypothetical protein